MDNRLFDVIARCTTEIPVGEVSFRANPHVPDVFGVVLSWEIENRRCIVMRNIPSEGRDFVAATLDDMLSVAKTKLDELKGAER